MRHLPLTLLVLSAALLPLSAQDTTLPVEIPAPENNPAASTAAPEPSPAPATATAPATPDALPLKDNPAPSDEFSQKVLPPEPVKKPIPTSSGDRSGQIWIGHRATIDRYAGWGWIKKDKEPWSRAKWVMLEEIPRKSFAPGRHYSRPTQDDGMTYRMFGDFADYKGYEPNYDVFVDVFRIRGWETVGREERPNLRPPRGSAGGPPRWSERGANMRR